MKTAFSGLMAAALFTASVATAAEIISSNIASDGNVPVVVRNVGMMADGTVAGTVVNTSPNPVRDPEVMVQYQWLWTNERHPGVDNPGFAESVSLRGEIPPGGKLPFTHVPSGGLPQRGDGRFEPAARVTSFTEILPPGTTSERSFKQPPAEGVAVGRPMDTVVSSGGRPVQAVVVSSGRGEAIQDDARTSLVVRDLTMTGDGTISGNLVNRGNHVIRDPQLQVQFAWLWADEFRPGIDNPGWTDTVSVRGEIPPGGTLPFVHTPSGGLPRRADGRFQPQVSVLSFTEVGSATGY